MKKVLGFLMVSLMAVCLTGCGNSSKNTITCTQTEDDEKTVVTATTDKNDKVVKVKMTTEVKAPSKEELESGYQIYKASAGLMSSAEGVKVDVAKKDLTLVLTVDIDLNKASKEVLSSFNLDEIDTTGTEFRKNAEEDGATCK